MSNKSHPEGSIAEAYIVNESLSFCSMYFTGVETKFNRTSRNYDGAEPVREGYLSVFSKGIRPFGNPQGKTLTRKERELVHSYILNNCDELQPYLL